MIVTYRVVNEIVKSHLFDLLFQRLYHVYIIFTIHLKSLLKMKHAFDKPSKPFNPDKVYQKSTLLVDEEQT